jgi:lysozyme
MRLVTSDKGLDFITEVEGNKLEAYKDTGGVWTVGVGHTTDKHLNVLPGLKISKELSRWLLTIDVAEAEDSVNRLVNVPLNQNQFDALVSFVFNLGEGNFASSTLLKKLNAGDYGAVRNQLARWVYDNGKLLAGLVKRREGEANLFEG